MKKVTIAIAMYNHAQYLSECISSALNQTYKNIEILAVNDASTDQTHNIVQSFMPYSKIRYYKNEKNIGIVKTYNKLLELADGHYFMILGDDDILGMDYIERTVMVMEERPSCRVAFGRNVILNQDSSVSKELISTFGRYISGLEYCNLWLSGHPTFQQHAFIMMFCPVDIVRKAGGFPDFQMAQHADNALFIKMIIDGDVGYDSQADYYYRVYSQSYGNQHVAEVGEATLQFLEYFKTDILPKLVFLKGNNVARKMLKNLNGLLIETFIHRILKYYAPNHSIRECINLLTVFNKQNSLSYYKFILKYFILKHGIKKEKD